MKKEYPSNLDVVLQKLQQHNLHIKSTKCKFMQDNVEYLGQVVSKHDIHTSEGKLEVILKIWPISNQRSLRLLLDIVNYYRKLLSFLANLSAPMNELLKKDALNWAKFYNSKKVQVECTKSLLVKNIWLTLYTFMKSHRNYQRSTKQT